jgi:ATP-binding cassette subfamily B protein
MAFIQYMGHVLMSFMMLLVIILNIPRIMVSFKRINEILETNVSIKNNGTIKLKELERIEFKNVFFKYEGAKNDLLKDISFKILKGETVGVIGSSGSGKTTIVNLLLRHIEPTNGEILINGIDIKDYDIESLRNIFAYTPQKTLLFKGSLKENLLFDKKYDSIDVDTAMNVAAIKDFVDNNTEGYNYQIEQSAVNLSGGQKQRMAIARALIQKTEIILFDEATSALDNETQRKIQDAINNLKNEYTIMIIAHRFSTILNCDKIFFIDKGKVLDSGTHEELLKKCKEYKKLYESEIKES